MLPETSSISAILQFLEYSDPIDNYYSMYSLKLLQFSLLESSPKISYRNNGRLYSILVYSGE
jgi:hypothetical protein